MRLFFALWPPRETARALAEWAGKVQKESGGRVTAEASIHLTLAFLGEADPVKAGAAGESVTSGAFELPVDIAKYWKHNRIVWVGPREVPAGLSALASSLHERLKADGFALEDRPFAAHVTLVRKAAPPRALPPLPVLRWPAEAFVLVRSIPAGRLARYEVVRRFVLRGGET